jgi:hypothetical protein
LYEVTQGNINEVLKQRSFSVTGKKNEEIAGQEGMSGVATGFEN